MTNDSIKLAQFWTELKDMKNKLDNEVIPIAGHLRIEAPELIDAMEKLSGEINTHFDKFKLVVQTERSTQ